MFIEGSQSLKKNTERDQNMPPSHLRVIKRQKSNQIRRFLTTTPHTGGRWLYKAVYDSAVLRLHPRNGNLYRCCKNNNRFRNSKQESKNNVF